jgi:FAD/FMN-containing dehydrogenase
MSASTNHLLQRSQFRTPKLSAPTVVTPTHPAEIREVLDLQSRYLPPFRPVGANSCSTACDSSSGGTMIDMTGLDKIRKIDIHAYTVTVQAGVRIGDLAEELAAVGLELAGSHDLANRTIGGAVAGACVGPAFGADGGLFASQVRSVRVITPAGKSVEICQDQSNLLNAFRLSYGMLGVIYEVTLEVRPIRPFAVKHRRCTFEQFAGIAEMLKGIDVGLKFYMLPFRDRIYVDLRRYSKEAGAAHLLPWKIKDWGESTVLPNVFRSLNRLVPVTGVRDRLIDEISQVTHGLVNNRLVSTGSISTSQLASARDNRAAPELNYSTWFFPAAEFAIVVHAYRDFCLRIRNKSGYRCDMPTIGFRVGRDRSAMLSPSFDEPMIALRAISTQADGWENFVIDFGEFARHWGGIPVFNQTRDIPADYPRQVFGTRLAFFKKIRKQFDPEDRMMNVFLSQYFL